MATWDVVIIGGGQAGPPLAFALAKAGKKVALFEASLLGGSCVNFGCTPTKAAIASGKLAHRARRASDFGLMIPTVEVDFPAVIDGAHAVAERSRLGLEDWFAGAEGGNPKLLRGHARIAGKKGEHFVVAVGDESHLASTVVLNTGTRSRLPPIAGLPDCQPYTAENWIERKKLPKRLAMIGGGIVSIELAQFYQRMGSKVTVIEHGPQILGTEDEDVAEKVRAYLEGEGIEFRTGLDLASVHTDAGGLVLTCAGTSGACEVHADDVFYSIGRQANTDDIGLDTVGVEVDAHGIVQVDKHLQTSVKGIYASGDIRPGYQLTSSSWDDFRIIENHLLHDGSHTAERVIPYGVFTDPQIGHVGKHEKELKKAGIDYKLLKFEMSDHGLAREERETDGFIKVMIDPKTERVLGATVWAATGVEMVHLYAQLMVSNLGIGAIREAVMAHPSYAEAVQSAVSG